MQPGGSMKSFTGFLFELYTNKINKGWRPIGGSPLGIKPHPDAEKIGTLKSGDHVYHRVSKAATGTTHHYYVAGEQSGKTNIHLSTWQPRGHKAEEIGVLHANKSSKGAHHLYQHLVVKHNKILTADDQSEGARKVWERAGKHPKINIHGVSGRKAIHAHPSEDEHYVSPGELHAHQLDAMKATSKKDKKKAMADVLDKEKTSHTRLVMHKK